MLNVLEMQEMKRLEKLARGEPLSETQKMRLDALTKQQRVGVKPPVNPARSVYDLPVARAMFEHRRESEMDQAVQEYLCDYSI